MAILGCTAGDFGRRGCVDRSRIRLANTVFGPPVNGNLDCLTLLRSRKENVGRIVQNLTT
jgi:hypothetical protein